MKDLRNGSRIEDFFDMKHFNDLKPLLIFNVLWISLSGAFLYLNPFHQTIFSLPVLVCSIGTIIAHFMVNRVYFDKSTVFSFWHFCATLPIAYGVLFVIDLTLKSLFL